MKHYNFCKKQTDEEDYISIVKSSSSVYTRTQNLSRYLSRISHWNAVMLMCVEIGVIGALHRRHTAFQKQFVDSEDRKTDISAKKKTQHWFY